MDVQIFGVKKSAETRKALRFFAERRMRTHFVDLQERAASRGELTRFAQKFGAQALIDDSSRRYAELGPIRRRTMAGDPGERAPAAQDAAGASRQCPDDRRSGDHMEELARDVTRAAFIGTRT
jgi:hypothetical protein